MDLSEFQSLITANVGALDTEATIPGETRFEFAPLTMDSIVESFVSSSQVPDGILNIPNFLTAMEFDSGLAVEDRDYVGTMHDLFLDNDSWGGVSSLLADAVTYLHCYAVDGSVYVVGVFTDESGSWAVGVKSTVS